MAEKIMITSGVVRIVQGDVYKPSTTDMKGNPLVYKTGPDAGRPRVDYFLKVASPKSAETHWAQTPWGQKVWNAGAQFWNGNTNLFWKIEDGDDSKPNIERKGKKNCDNEGWKGNWIIKLGSSFAPKLVHQVGSEFPVLTEEGFIKCGDYVEVYFEVKSNNDSTKPGLLYNPAAICFRAHGDGIYSGVDVAEAGFGQAPMPANAKVQTFEASVTAPAPIPAIPVIPNLQFGSVPTPPPPAPVVPVPAAKQMTPAANGITYEAYKASGWTDEMLVSNGLMLP